MLSLAWSATALESLDAITDYIADRNALAAGRVQQAVEDCAERLAQHPYMYRPGRIEGTREAVFTPIIC